MFGRWRKRAAVSGSTQPASSPDRSSPIVVDIGRKELFESGFTFCGPPIVEAFALSGITLELDDQRAWPEDSGIEDDGLTQCLWVDDDHIIETIGHGVEFELADGSTNGLSALEWDLLIALRQKFSDPSDPERDWHVAGMDDGIQFVLCRPDQLDSLPGGPRQPIDRAVNLNGARVIRRGVLDQE